MKDLVEVVIKLFSYLLGIYYVSNLGICSWYEFVKVIMEDSGLVIVILFVMIEEYGNKMFCLVYFVLSYWVIEEVGICFCYWWEVLWEYLQERSSVCD